MSTIEIDFEVFKALTALRASEDVTYNAVIRDLLNLPRETQAQGRTKGGYTTGDVHFPDGTEFRATYKGRVYSARIEDGAWIGEDGVARKSPSNAASAITRNNVNGWGFWSARRPGEHTWKRLSEFRK